MRPSRASTGWPSTSARISTSGPVSSIHGARMKTARTRLAAVADVEVGLEAPHLPPERVPPHGVVADAEVVAVEHDHPRARAEDRRRRTRAPPRRGRRGASGARSRSTRRRGRSGRRGPSSCAGRRTSTGSAPRRRSIAACSRKFPCTARTPIRSGLSTARIVVTAGPQTALSRAPAGAQAERDEQEADEREDERAAPRGAAPRGCRRRGTWTPVAGPVDREVRRRGEQPDRGEHGPARAAGALRDPDVDERGDRDSAHCQSLVCHQ